ncbi:MAG: hypothetical protein QW279_14830, partial [Candidatus Jordarchaeaceae archaeon]
EIEVLLLFNNDDAKLRGFSFGFQGIRRLLDIHQQTLTIALKRLVRKRIIAKNDDQEYFLTKQGEKIVSNLFSNDENKMVLPPNCEGNKFTSCKIDMKVNLKGAMHKKLAKNLKGKWFSYYRYVGSSMGEDKSILEWITDDAKYSARVIADEDGNIKVVVSGFKSSDGMKLREEINKVSLFIEKNIKELFGEFPTYKSEIESVKNRAILDLTDLNQWIEEIYKSQISQGYS